MKNDKVWAVAASSPFAGRRKVGGGKTWNLDYSGPKCLAAVEDRQVCVLSYSRLCLSLFQRQDKNEFAHRKDFRGETARRTVLIPLQDALETSSYEQQAFTTSDLLTVVGGRAIRITLHSNHHRVGRDLLQR